MRQAEASDGLTRRARLEVSGDMLAELLRLPENIVVGTAHSSKEDYRRRVIQLCLEGTSLLLPPVKEGEIAPKLDVLWARTDGDRVFISKWTIDD